MQAEIEAKIRDFKDDQLKILELLLRDPGFNAKNEAKKLNTSQGNFRTLLTSVYKALEVPTDIPHMNKREWVYEKYHAEYDYLFNRDEWDKNHPPEKATQPEEPPQIFIKPPEPIREEIPAEEPRRTPQPPIPPPVTSRVDRGGNGSCAGGIIILLVALVVIYVVITSLTTSPDSSPTPTIKITPTLLPVPSPIPSPTPKKFLFRTDFDNLEDLYKDFNVTCKKMVDWEWVDASSDLIVNNGRIYVKEEKSSSCLLTLKDSDQWIDNFIISIKFYSGEPVLGYTTDRSEFGLERSSYSPGEILGVRWSWSQIPKENPVTFEIIVKNPILVNYYGIRDYFGDDHKEITIDPSKEKHQVQLYLLPGSEIDYIYVEEIQGN